MKFEENGLSVLTVNILLCNLIQTSHLFFVAIVQFSYSNFCFIRACPSSKRI